MQALTQTHKSVTNETGFYNLVDLLTNREHATPFNLPPIKKTSASRIVDRAITDYLALIPEPEYGNSALSGRRTRCASRQASELHKVTTAEDHRASGPGDARSSANVSRMTSALVG